MYPKAVARTLAVLGAVLVGLIVVRWHQWGGLAVDHWVAARLTPVAGWLLTGWLRHVTDPWYVLVVAWLLALRHELAGRRRRALALVVPVVAALAVTELVLKPGVGARATSGTWTFPSGNVTGGFALLATVYWVEGRHGLRTRRRAAAVVGLAVVVGLSSFALVANRTHFFTDAVGAVCVGVGVPLALLARRQGPSRLPKDGVEISRPTGAKSWSSRYSE